MARHSWIRGVRRSSWWATPRGRWSCNSTQTKPRHTSRRVAVQGFNTLLVNLIEHEFADDPPRNASGEEPFVDGDFARPNPSYFDAAHDSIEQAAAMGFVVMLTPAYLGYNGGDEGWYPEMVAAGPDELRSYGRFVGERFADLDNIIWVNGGDFTPPPEGLELVEAVRDGLLEGGATQLQTAHWAREQSAIDVDVDWLDLNTTYTAPPVYVKSVSDDTTSPLPHVLIEGQYEDDRSETTEQLLRSQTYEAVFTGAIGSVFGNGTIWQFADGWPDAVNSNGANDVSRRQRCCSTLFGGTNWSPMSRPRTWCPIPVHLATMRSSWPRARPTAMRSSLTCPSNAT